MLDGLRSTLSRKADEALGLEMCLRGYLGSSTNMTDRQINEAIKAAKANAPAIFDRIVKYARIDNE